MKFGPLNAYFAVRFRNMSWRRLVTKTFRMR